MRYFSTRGGDELPNFESVATAGLARDGGLYVPVVWPQYTLDEIGGFAKLNYPELVTKIVEPFVDGCISQKDLLRLAEETYSFGNFKSHAVAPVKQIGYNEHMLELFHGPTLAFKDFALQFIGKLLNFFLARSGKKVTIVGATSGDTGSAAIMGCVGCENVNIFILHPKGRVTDVQRKQMTTVDEPNVFNLAVEGNFDDCQDNIKSLFNDAEFREKHNLTAVNSINWARIMAQIVYYFYCGLSMGAPYKQTSYSVPTGNFGDVFAGYVARKMGLPIHRLIIATNKNDILHRFLQTGVYCKAEVQKTITPSMDIQVSSNFERLLFDVYNKDGRIINQYMKDFKRTQSLRVEDEQVIKIRNLFSSARVNEEETMATMKQVYEQTGEIIDPHTAIGIHSARKVHDVRRSPVVTLATAHPAKFPDAVEKAIGIRPELPPYLADLHERPEKFETIGNSLEEFQSYIEAKNK